MSDEPEMTPDETPEPTDSSPAPAASPTPAPAKTKGRRTPPAADDTSDEDDGPVVFNDRQQAWLNERLGETRKKARERAQQEFLESLGVDSPDKLKEMLAAYQQAEQEKLSESERARQQVTQAQQEMERLQRLAQQREQQARDALILGELKAMSRNIKIGEERRAFRDWEIVATFINPDDFEVDLETGAVTGMDKKLREIARKYDYLLEPVDAKAAPPSEPDTETTESADQATMSGEATATEEPTVPPSVPPTPPAARNERAASEAEQEAARKRMFQNIRNWF